MGKAWDVMVVERGESPAVVITEPPKGEMVKVRGELVEDIFAGIHDKDSNVDDSYLSIEKTEQGPDWHLGTMEQKVAYRSLMSDQPTYMVDEGELHEAETDIEVESSYGVFLEEVQIGDRAVLRKPGPRFEEFLELEQMAAPAVLKHPGETVMVQENGEQVEVPIFSDLNAELTAGDLGGYGLPGFELLPEE